MEQYQPRQISVVEPVGAAIEKTKEILFRPFDIGKWFTIGFCAFLATLGDGGGTGPNGNFGGGQGGQSQDFGQEMSHLKETVIQHLPVIIAVAAAVIIFILMLSILFAWLKSRGQFMFLHCVARNVAEVVNPWKECAQSANSLFIFKIILGLVSLICIMIPVVAIIFLLAGLHGHSQVAIPSIMGVIFLGIILFVLAILFGAIGVLINDFVVPIMYIHNCGIKEGWQRFWALCKLNIGKFFLFLLFLVVVNIAIAVIALTVVLGACCLCCVGIIFFIPYIGTVAMLPLLVWRRAYSALFLAQFGSEFDVFAQASPVVVPGMSDPPAGLITEDVDLPPQPPEQNF